MNHEEELKRPLMQTIDRQDFDGQQQMSGQDNDIDDQQEPLDPDAEKLVVAAMDILYDKSTLEQNTQFLQTGKPVVSIPTLAAKLVVIVDEKSGNNIPEDAIVPAAVKIMEEVEIFAAKAGIELTEKDEDDAYSVLIQDLMQSYGTTEEQMQELINKPEINKELQQAAVGGR